MNLQQSSPVKQAILADAITLTVIVPTFNESDNVAELIGRVSSCLGRRDMEILFVDDSNDDTPRVIEQVAAKSPVPVRLMHRPPGLRHGGLAGAVTAGLGAARGRYVVVMDGDLQHPPELLPSLLAVLQGGDKDVVVASRYSGTGAASGLAGSWRRHVSRGSTTLARALFPQRVGRRCTDPMTGFFGLDRESVDLDRLQARGFKILLEILVSHDLRVEEVPFTFAERHSGVSKASWRRGVEFMAQLLRLRCRAPFVRFAGVGIVGAGLNLAIMAILLTHGAGYLLAAVVASEVTIVTNFLLQERVVFHEAAAHRRFWVRAFHSAAINNAELLLRIPVLAFLVRALHIAELPAAALALVLASAGRYLVLSRYTYRKASAATAPEIHQVSHSLSHATVSTDTTDQSMEVA